MGSPATQRQRVAPGWLLLAAAALAAFPGFARAQDADSRDRYRILIDRNIFQRDRYRRPSRPAMTRVATPRRAPAATDSDEYLVLTGVARRDGEFVAFFENTRSESLVKARVGEAIGHGRLLDIRLDAVLYERQTGRRTIRIGRSLTGGERIRPAQRPRVPEPPRAATAAKPAGATTQATQPASPGTPPEPGTPPPGPAAPAATSQPAATPPPKEPANSNMNDILERMRLRRERELRR